MTVGTLACTVQIWCVLLQQKEHQTSKPIDYSRRSLTYQKRKFDTSKRKLLAILWDVLLSRPYEKGIKFTMTTDHDSLNWILSLPESTGRLTRCRLQLSEFAFDAVHRAGPKKQTMDALSMLPTSGDEIVSLDEDLPLLKIEKVHDRSNMHILRDRN